MKKLVSLFLALVMLLSMATIPAFAEEKTVIRFWTRPFEDYTQRWYEYWIEEFNNTHDDVYVEVSFVPDSSWTEKLKAAQGAGTTPDVWVVNLNEIAKEYSLGSLMPMDEYVGTEPFEKLEETFQNVAKMADGHYYAMPYQVEAGQMLFYRKDMFEAAGLDPNQPPKSWEEVIEYAKKLTTDTVYGINLNTDDHSLSWTTYGMQCNFNGGYSITENWDKANINNDNYREMFSVFKRLHDDGSAPESSISGTFGIAGVAEGVCAMLCSGSWNFQRIVEDYPDMVDLIGVAPAPNRDGDYTHGSSAVGGWSLAVDAKSEHPKEAAEFVTWLLAGDPQIMIDFCTRAGFGKVPVRKDVSAAVAEDPAMSSNEWLLCLMNEVMPYGVLEPIFPWDISLAVGQAINRVTTFGQSIDDSLAQAEEEINTIIEQNQLAGTNPAYTAE